MSIQTTCPHCGQAGRVPDAAAGRKVKCPSCQNFFVVPASAPPPPARRESPPDDAIEEAIEEAVEETPRSRSGRGRLVPEDLDEEPPRRGRRRSEGAGRNLELMRAYKYVFASPNWKSNVLMGGLCALIPVVGIIAVDGYCWEVAERLHREGDDDYPDFVFGKFGDYLTRGIKPFVAGLLLFAPVIMLVMCLGVGGSLLASGGGKNLGGLFIAVVYLVYFVGIFIASFLSSGLVLYTGMGNTLSLGNAFRFAIEFLKSVAGKLLVSWLFLFVTGVPILLAGYLVCCVGYLPALVIVMLAQHHVYYQLYEVHLDRGGSPIPEPGTVADQERPRSRRARRDVEED